MLHSIIGWRSSFSFFLKVFFTLLLFADQIGQDGSRRVRSYRTRSDPRRENPRLKYRNPAEYRNPVRYYRSRLNYKVFWSISHCWFDLLSFRTDLPLVTDKIRLWLDRAILEMRSMFILCVARERNNLAQRNSDNLYWSPLMNSTINSSLRKVPVVTKNKGVKQRKK